MEAYILLFVIIAILYLFIGRRTVRNMDYLCSSVHRKTKLSIILLGSIIFCLIAFRNISVGIDTKSYLWTFERLGQSIPKLEPNLTAEYGYRLLQLICIYTKIGFRGILVFEAAIYVIPTMYCIYKYSSNPYLSIFYFITLDYFLFGMTGIRQSIALGFCMIAFEMSQRKRFLPFIVFVLMATTFHSTAIIFIPVYFLSYASLKKRNIYLLLGLGALFYILRVPLGIFIRQYARTYYNDINTGGMGMYLYLLAAVLLLLLTTDIKANMYLGQNTIGYMLALAVVMYPVLKFNPTVFRLHYYYSIALIIFLPNAIRQLNNWKTRLTINTVFFTVALYYFLEYSSQNMGALPYSLGF